MINRNSSAAAIVSANSVYCRLYRVKHGERGVLSPGRQGKGLRATTETQGRPVAARSGGQRARRLWQQDRTIFQTHGKETGLWCLLPYSPAAGHGYIQGRLSVAL